MKNVSIEKSVRLVLKIGSSLLIKNNKFDKEWLETLIEDLIFFRKQNIEIIIVASGSVSLGKNYLNIKKNKAKIQEKQAFAACGQVILMNNFMKILKKKKINVAQILLTYSDTEDRKKSINSRETIKELLKLGVLPIINENDSVAIEELKFGDNDRLAARVAQISDSDFLILLSDVAGLYTSNPKKNKSAKLLKFVEEIDKKILKMASMETNLYGTGGMKTKLEAAKIAMSSGCSTIICRGNRKNPIQKYFKNNHGTVFISKKKGANNIKNWIAGTVNPLGKVVVDSGAKIALKNGASLLPIGVTKVFGSFFKGDIIKIESIKGEELGKGISHYDCNEIKKIKGKKTSDLKNILGYHGRDEIIHRDFLKLND